MGKVAPTPRPGRLRARCPWVRRRSRGATGRGDRWITVASPVSILATRDWLDRTSFATAACESPRCVRSARRRRRAGASPRPARTLACSARGTRPRFQHAIQPLRVFAARSYAANPSHGLLHPSRHQTARADLVPFEIRSTGWPHATYKPARRPPDGRPRAGFTARLRAFDQSIRSSAFCFDLGTRGASRDSANFALTADSRPHY
jgi:hypothetical protein